MKEKIKTRNIARIILSVLFAISIFAAFVTGIVTFVFSNVDMMKKSVVTDKYIESLSSTVESALEYECLSLSVDYDAIIPGVDKEILRELSEQYYENIGNAVLHNIKMKEIRYPSEQFLEPVRGFFAVYQQENAVTIPEGQDAVVATELANTVTGNICMLGQNITTRFSSFTSAVERALSALRIVFFSTVVLSLVFAVWVFLTSSKNGAKRLFQFAAPLFIIASLVFAPSAAYFILDPMKNLAIGASPLRDAVTSYFNSAFGSVFISTIIFFIISSAALICGIVFSIKGSSEEQTAER